MKKLLITTGVAIVGLGWFFYEKPEPQFIGDSEIQPTEVPTYFAEIDASGLVLRVIVADQAFIDSGAVGDPKNWVQTYIDGSQKKNYASPDWTYDKNSDAFIAPKPAEDYELDPNTSKWYKPTPIPISPTASI